MESIKKFKDNDDYVIKLSDDNIINIIGTKGSGKTTTSQQYISNDDYIVVNCDRLFDMPENIKLDKEFIKLKEYLIYKFGDLSKVVDFSQVYDSIIDYITKLNKVPVIEGNIIQDLPIDTIKGKIIVKRTAVFKSFYRAVKRDYKNEYFMKLEKESHKYIYKFTRLKKITKRRLKIFNQAHSINNLIDSYENRNIKK